jgi:ParB-like chromosome segregation protein Spo0J
MEKKNSNFSILKLNQLEFNPDLKLGVSKNVSNNIKTDMHDYGNIYPIIVGETENSNIFRIIKGQHIVDIGKKLGIKEFNSTIINDKNTRNQRLLSLKMSTINDNIGPISQGALIEQLISENNLTLAQLSGIVGNSKSWLSKRLSLKKNLSDDVKELLNNNTIHPRTAEEIAKLPMEEQNKFVLHVINNHMTKDTVGKLVKLYNDPDSSAELKEKIINSPSDVSLMDHERIKKKSAAEKTENLEGVIESSLKSIKLATSIITKIDRSKILSVEHEINCLSITAKNLIISIERILAKK